MKAIICKKFAPVSDLVWEEVADPVAGPGEVVVDIKAAGLNYPDNLIVQGLYQFQPERPFSPGHEGAGVVSSVGEGVDMHSVGDSVAFFKGFGAFAEKCYLRRWHSQFLKAFLSTPQLVFLWFMAQAIMPLYKGRASTRMMKF